MTATTLFFDHHGRPTEPLADLLDLLQVRHDNTLPGIRDATQQAWLHKGRMRVEIKEDPELPRLRGTLLPLFTDLGLVEAVHASGELKHCLLLGAVLKAVRKRIRHLRDEWHAGVRFHEMNLLGSERPLNEDEDATHIFWPENPELPYKPGRHYEAPQPPRVEAEMMRVVYHQAQPELPWDVHVNSVRAAGTVGAKQTAQQWLQQYHPTTGRVLVVSSQPFLSHQLLVVEKEIKSYDPKMEVVGIGYAAPPQLEVAKYLDNIARVIYELANQAGV